MALETILSGRSFGTISLFSVVALSLQISASCGEDNTRTIPAQDSTVEATPTPSANNSSPPSSMSSGEEILRFPSEKTVYKRSLLDTDVYQLTTHGFHDFIIYPEPRYQRPGTAEFLFISERNFEQSSREFLDLDRMQYHTVDLVSGDIRRLSSRVHCGWTPTWSSDGRELYKGFVDSWGRFGHRSRQNNSSRQRALPPAGILAINAETGHERFIEVPVTLPENVPRCDHAAIFISYLHLSPDGRRLGFVEEYSCTIRFADGSREESPGVALSSIELDETGNYIAGSYRHLLETDAARYVGGNPPDDAIFHFDRPQNLGDRTLVLTRGRNWNIDPPFQKPYMVTLAGEKQQFPRDCSHYNLNPHYNSNPERALILCGQEGYILDFEGNMVREYEGVYGHGVWSDDGNLFLVTGDPVPVPDGPYFRKIVLREFDSGAEYIFVDHEDSYDSLLHDQPNTQFVRFTDGTKTVRAVVYNSDRGQNHQNIDLFMALLPPRFNNSLH